MAGKRSDPQRIEDFGHLDDFTWMGIDSFPPESSPVRKIRIFPFRSFLAWLFVVTKERVEGTGHIKSNASASQQI